MLEVKNSAMIVIDVQEKLARVMHGKTGLLPIWKCG
jgi:hypothetical protein